MRPVRPCGIHRPPLAGHEKMIGFGSLTPVVAPSVGWEAVLAVSAKGVAGRDVARLYDALRTAHLERFAAMTPADVLYLSERYDFDPSLAPPSVRLRKVNRLQAILAVGFGRYRAVEVNEPLMTARWIDLLCLLFVLRVVGRCTGRRTTVSAYCIGLTDPAEKLRQRHGLPPALGRTWSRFVLRVLVRGVDRLAIGTQASRDLLASYVGDAAVDRRAHTFLALPNACTCDPGPARRAREVLFVGALEEHKGIPLLMRAWERLRDADALTLRIIGKGSLARDVQNWAADRPDVTVELDSPRDVIHAAYRRAHAVVLLSQRKGYWREQVGLPIVEALAHGCEVVTTEETGLADWLDAHHHAVLAADADPDIVAKALQSAAEASRTAADVLAALPTEDARLAADRWMLRDHG
jgi:glycosyltransferase involved in cell wall biosynthesis